MFVIGHRGARALAPENTLAALRRGMACAPFVEVDVRLSSDGKLVVMHDATVDRTTDGRGEVGSLTLAELKRLDAGGGERIPLFAEVLDLVAGSGGGLVVEIKEPGSEGAVCEHLARVKPDPLLVVSFYPESIRRVGDLLGGVATGVIYSRELADPVRLAVSVHATAILPKFPRVIPALVEEAHAGGLSVIAWTLNTETEFARAVSLGIDGFASDDPCRAGEFLAEHGG